jgi:HIRAN domain
MRPIPSIPPVESVATRLRVRRRSWLMSAAALLSTPSSAQTSALLAPALLPALSPVLRVVEQTVLPSALQPVTPPKIATLPERTDALAPALARELLQISPVAGFQFHEGERLWESLAVGDALALVREAANRYDARAVRLDWQGQKIGYIPAVDNAAVSQLLDRGRCLSACITQLRMSGNPWQRVEVQVFLEGAD